MPDQPDADLLRRFVQGDRDAFESLFRQFEREVFRCAVGLHGALLPLLLIPGGVALTRLLDVFTIPLRFAFPIIPIGMVVYYLAWKYLVGFLNEEMGIA